MSVVVLGIDPGLHGGLAVLTRDGDPVDLKPMPVVGGEVDGNALAVYLLGIGVKHTPAMVAMEKVGARPGQGVCSMFTFGVGYGMVRGILTTLGIPHELVTPKKWQAHVVGGTDGPDPKAKALLYVTRRFPGLNLKATTRSRKPHDGLVDAVCLAEYARRLSFGGSPTC